MDRTGISRFFGLGMDDWQPDNVEIPGSPIIQLDGEGLDEDQILAKAILASYEIADDDRTLRDNPELFEQLRGDYPVRREFDFYSIQASNIRPDIISKLARLGFNLMGMSE